MFISKLRRYFIASILAIVDDRMRIAAVLFLKTRYDAGFNFHSEFTIHYSLSTLLLTETLRYGCRSVQAIPYSPSPKLELSHDR